MNVQWTERASKDALSIYDYIAEHSETYADSVYARILARPNQLVDNPESGSIVPEYNRTDVRELLVHSFRLIYRIAGDETRVLTVIHGSRQLPPNIRNRVCYFNAKRRNRTLRGKRIGRLCVRRRIATIPCI